MHDGPGAKEINNWCPLSTIKRSLILQHVLNEAGCVEQSTDNGDILTSIQHKPAAPVSSTNSGEVHSSTMNCGTTSTSQSPITGQDRNLNLHRADSNSSMELEPSNARCGQVEEPNEGREAPEISGMGLPPTALHNSCLPENVTSQGQTVLEQECDPAEIYPNHKKFRMHRKRAAAMLQSTQSESKPHPSHDDSPAPEAKKNCTSINTQNTGSTPANTNIINSTNMQMSNTVDSSKTTTNDNFCRAATTYVSSVQEQHVTRDSLDDASLNVDVTSLNVDVTSECPTIDDESSSDERMTPVEDEMKFVGEEQSSSTTLQSGDSWHACGWLQCLQQFRTLDDLVNHVNEAHIRAERDIHYKCYWKNCPRRGKGFNARYKMLIHVRTHTNERPYKCNLCNKSFSRLENLKIHNRSHTGERPYVCPFEGCKKAYSNSSDRFKHVRTHQEQKPYSCRMPGCDKRYTDPSSLRKHIKTHGHYYRGPVTSATTSPSNEKSGVRLEADMTNSPRKIDLEMSSSQQHKMPSDMGRFEANKEMFSPNNHLLASSFLPHAYQTSNHSILSPRNQISASLLELRAREDFQNKARLEQNLFSGLSLPRHPLLGLSLPFSIAEATAYSLTAPTMARPSTGLLMPLPANVSDNRSYLASLGSTGSLSPGSLSDATHSAYSDSEGTASPPLVTRGLSSSAFDAPHLNSVFSAAQVPKSSAFSPVPQSSFCSSTDKYTYVPGRTPLVNRHPRHSPLSPHPYSRAEYTRAEIGRPLDLSASPGNPMSESERELSAARLSTSYSLSLPPMHCNTAPKCDLTPAFPALRLLNHA